MITIIQNDLMVKVNLHFKEILSGILGALILSLMINVKFVYLAFNWTREFILHVKIKQTNCIQLFPLSI